MMGRLLLYKWLACWRIVLREPIGASAGFTAFEVGNGWLDMSSESNYHIFV
jgi:hypothetical protein